MSFQMLINYLEVHILINCRTLKIHCTYLSEHKYSDVKPNNFEVETR